MLLECAVELIDDYELREFCKTILRDKRFLLAPASCKHHHVYDGGLLVHTAEVATYALASAVPLGTVNTTILTVAAVAHDYAKIFDYEYNKTEGKWVNAPYRDSIRHVSGSHAYFVSKMDGKIHLSTQRAIEHCILSHHGRPEWGSPVEPKTIEALLLHQADMVSAGYGLGR